MVRILGSNGVRPGWTKVCRRSTRPKNILPSPMPYSAASLRWTQIKNVRLSLHREVPIHWCQSRGGSSSPSWRRPRSSGRSRLGRGASFRSSCGEFEHTGGEFPLGRDPADFACDVTCGGLREERGSAVVLSSSRKVRTTNGCLAFRGECPRKRLD